MNEDKRGEVNPETKAGEMNPEDTPENQAESQAQNQANASDAADAQTAADEASEAASEEAALIAQLRDELAAAQSKADDYLDKLQRTAADFQNSRRRLENQLKEEVERANASLISQLLPVLDDLDLAFQNVPPVLLEAENSESTADNGAGSESEKQQAAWLQGFRQIRKKLLDLLSDQGLEAIDTSGEFDPNQHEAISSEPSDTVPSGHIISVLRGGYIYKGRVLRPALVRVAM